MKTPRKDKLSQNLNAACQRRGLLINSRKPYSEEFFDNLKTTRRKVGSKTRPILLGLEEFPS